MMQEPSGPPPERPKPGGDFPNSDDTDRKKNKQASMVWIVGPVLAFILFAFLIILLCVLRRRRQNTKQPLEQGAVLTPLMSGFEMNNAQIVAAQQAAGGAVHLNGNGTLDGTMPPSLIMDMG